MDIERLKKLKYNMQKEHDHYSNLSNIFRADESASDIFKNIKKTIHEYIELLEEAAPEIKD